MMKKTPFPSRPVDVVPLSIQEFTSSLDLSGSPSLDDVCGRFPDDVNRALVWLLRYRALKTLTDDAEMTIWLANGAGSTRHACDVAATLSLNERWEFDRRAFCAAVEALVNDRT